MWEFASANPGYTFLIVWVLAWAVTRPFWYAFVSYKHTLRSRNIKAQGWPPAPIDADGDVVYPEEQD